MASYPSNVTDTRPQTIAQQRARPAMPINPTSNILNGPVFMPVHHTQAGGYRSNTRVIYPAEPEYYRLQNREYGALYPTAATGVSFMANRSTNSGTSNPAMAMVQRHQAGASPVQRPSFQQVHESKVRGQQTRRLENHGFQQAHESTRRAPVYPPSVSGNNPSGPSRTTGRGHQSRYVPYHLNQRARGEEHDVAIILANMPNSGHQTHQHINGGNHQASRSTNNAVSFPSSQSRRGLQAPQPISGSRHRTSGATQRTASIPSNLSKHGSQRPIQDTEERRHRVGGQPYSMARLPPNMPNNNGYQSRPYNTALHHPHHSADDGTARTWIPRQRTFAAPPPNPYATTALTFSRPLTSSTNQSVNMAAFPQPTLAYATRSAHTMNPNPGTGPLPPRNPPAQAPSSQPPVPIITQRAPPGGPTPRQRYITPRANPSERTRDWHARLNAVSGVRSPSLLLPGDSPIKARRKKDSSEATKDRSWWCPICGEGLSTDRHLMDHFIHCVGRNGNPEGKHWDDDIDWV